MKKFNYVWLVVALIALTTGFTSCKGDDKDPKSKTELISLTWKVQKATVNGTQVYMTGGTSNTENFDAYRLSITGNNFTRTEQSGTTSGTWSFTNNENTVQFSTGSPASVSITTLNENELTISYTETTAPGKPERNVVLFLIPA